jgi:hypothetical protein
MLTARFMFAALNTRWQRNMGKIVLIKRSGSTKLK